MSKTIDVEGWPPSGGGKDPAGSRWDGKGPRVPMFAVVAVGLAAMLTILVTFMAVTGRLGLSTIESSEIGVVVNYVSGQQEVVDQPGYVFYIPFIEEVFILDKSQQQFVMQGGKYLDANHVPQLSVRASDGSSFYFEEMPIQYQILAGEAETVLADSGPGDGYKAEWVKAHARSILRDEFGRFTAIEAANPTVFDQARIQAKDRLNEVLNPHGIEVVLIGTPNPKFDRAYEDAIEKRKSADQEVERLQAKLEQLGEEREQKLAEVERKKSVERNELVGDLTKMKLDADRLATETRKTAEAYATQRGFEAQAEKGQLIAKARGAEAKYRAEAEGLSSRAEALEQRGEVVVREALVEKLTGIKFTLVPYSRDAEPKRLEHVDGRKDGTKVDETVFAEGGR